MYPEADVPTLQLSMHQGYHPEAHLTLGLALAPLRDEAILIIGSGFGYPNLRTFGPAALGDSAVFDGWLQNTLLTSDTAARSEYLRHWAEAPAARKAHPQEDHLIPLMVAVGAAEGEAATCTHHEPAFMGNATVSSFRFGALPDCGCRRTWE